MAQSTPLARRNSASWSRRGERDGVLVVDVPDPRSAVRRGRRERLQGPVVSLGDPDAPLDPGLQVGKLDLEDGCLQGIQPAVEAGELMPVSLLRAMQADHAAPSGQIGIVGQQRSPVSAGAQMLGRIEAETTDIAQGPGALSPIAGSHGLGGVFDDPQLSLPGKGQDGLHIGGMAKEVDRQDGLGPGSDPLPDPAGIQVVGPGIDVRKDGTGSLQHDGLDRGGEGKGSGDDLVARADLQGHQRNPQSVGARGAPHRKAGPQITAQLGLELGHGPAHDEVAIFQNLPHGGLDGLPEAPVLALQIHHPDGRHGWHPFRAGPWLKSRSPSPS